MTKWSVVMFLEEVLSDAAFDMADLIEDESNEVLNFDGMMFLAAHIKISVLFDDKDSSNAASVIVLPPLLYWQLYGLCPRNFFAVVKEKRDS